MTDTLIVGAGPAGLVLAAVLADHGVDFRIIDRKSGPVEQSRAAIVHVRTLELLDRLGLADRAVAQGVETTRVQIYQRGRKAGQFALAGRGSEALTRFPFALGLPQDSLETLLVEWLAERGRQVEWNTPYDGEPSARWVVGADGARSTVRNSLGVGFTGSTYRQTGLLADVDLDPPVELGTIRLNLTRGGFVGMFPLREGRFRLFGAMPPGLTAQSRDHEISHEAYAEVPIEDVQHWFDEYFGIKARIRDAAWTALFRIHSRIADRFQSGNVFLIGDAAHIHSPAGGQGMNLAIGDAFNLGWKLALVAKGQAHQRLLDSYHSERHPIARAVLRGADRGFALETLNNPIARWIRWHVAAHLIGPMTRMDAVQAMVFRLFAQTWISYRHSPAVAGSDRLGLSPGDRLPGVSGGTCHQLLLPSVSPAARALLARYPMEIEVNDWPKPALCLVRPDGHIAYLGPPHDLAPLATYMDRLYVAVDT
jgi:2-polyprenyl-6-methoxyphenol hydroxylase-like FAD-dependent oxidoreductase